MSRPSATPRYVRPALIACLLGLLLGCGDSILIARELELEGLGPDAGFPTLDAGVRRKQAINAQRARARASARGGDHGGGSKRH